MAGGNVDAFIVEAREFRLVDDGGNILAVLGAGDNGSAALEIYKSGTPRLRVGTDEVGRVSLSLKDNAGTISARLSVDSSGSPTVFTIRDAPERLRAQILLQDDGGVGITLTDQSGNKSTSLETHADGYSYVALYDTDGNIVNGLSNEIPES